MKNYYSFFRRILVLFAGIFLSKGMLAQVSESLPADPVEWEAFVNGRENKLVMDTFRLQTFQQRPEDNWSYQPTSFEIISSEDQDFKGAHGDYLLKVPMAEEIHFARFDSTLYKSWIITLRFSCFNFPDDGLWWANTYRTWATKEVTIFTQSGVAGNTKSPSFRPVNISMNPLGASFFGTSASGDMDNAYAYIDSIYAYGEIPQYSLFTGNGSWNDSLRWSHLPAARHRDALIDGQVYVEGFESANSVTVGSGGIQIGENGLLRIKDLTLHAGMEQATYLESKGTLDLDGRLVVDLEMPSKGEWYFFSLPFDCELEDIAPEWEMGDSKTEGTGNYFYLATYDGDLRAQTGSASGNWRVVPVPDETGEESIIKRYKGYLLAIDEGASSNRIRFSSRRGAISSKFGSSERVNVVLNSSAGVSDSTHFGWKLVGNPTAAPLSIATIADNPDIGNQVYIYRNGKYQALDKRSVTSVAPFSAFFVQAKRETTLTLEPLITETALRAASPLAFSLKNGPEPMPLATGTAQIDSDLPAVSFDGEVLRIEPHPTPIEVVIYDLGGKIRWRESVGTAGGLIAPRLPAGIYLARIQSSGGCRTLKIAR